MIRYWELEKLEAAETHAAKPTKFVCKKCGAEGDHKSSKCPVLVVSSVISDNFSQFRPIRSA